MGLLSFLGAVLTCAALLVLQLVSADFTFQFQLDSISTSGNCFGDDLSLPCETYLAIFCLRAGPRGDFSTSTSDCSRGTSGRIGPSYDPPVTRQISSTRSWTGDFQIFVLARDDDHPFEDDDLDDIFINSSLQPNAGYSTTRDYAGRNNKVTIRMRFRVTCNTNFYGSSCDRFCVPQDDDLNGHYTCNSDGSIACLSGFEHPENSCRDRITACSSGPCEHGAPCTPIGLSNYSCQCPSGYTGRNCEVNINDCDPNPCENGGNCTDALASYTCACPPGFSGTNCDIDINECEEMGVDCPGNSTCVHGVNSYTCVCNAGFEGDNCTEIDPCDSNPCASGCLCVSMGPFSHQCQCPSTTLSEITTTEKSNVPEAAGRQSAVMAAVGAVVGILVIVVLVVFIVLTLVCALRRNSRKNTPYDIPEDNSRNGTLRNHEPATENHIYQTANGGLYQEIKTPDESAHSDYEGTLVHNPLYGSNPTTPVHINPYSSPSLALPTSLTLESAKSTDTLHNVANPLYGDTSPSPSHEVPGGGGTAVPLPQGPIYSVPRPASEAAKKEADSYPYSYASVATGIHVQTSVKGGNGSAKKEAPVSNNYEYVKMSSTEPLSPSLRVVTEPPRRSVYDDDFHYETVDVKTAVAPPMKSQDTEQKAASNTGGGSTSKPPLAPKPYTKNGVVSNQRTNGSIKVQGTPADHERSRAGADSLKPLAENSKPYDRLDHGIDSPSGAGETIRLAKIEGSGYEPLQHS